MNSSDQHRPPPLAQWLLARFLSPDEQMDVLGDLEEVYTRRVRERGVARAVLAYWAEVVVSLPVFLSRSLLWTVIMWKNYLTTALRTFRRHKAYSAINVLGLSVGLACSFFILLWVDDELSFDRYHEDGEQIYRVKANAHFADGRIFTRSAVPKPLDDVLDEEYPEITHSVLFGSEQDMVIARGDRAFRETGRHAGPDFFTVFSYPLIVGDPANALDNPNSIVLSENLTRKYFGDAWRTAGNILGQVIRIDNRLDVTVTGVFEEVPAHSSFRLDFVLPAEEYIRRNEWVEEWENSGLSLFVRLVDYLRKKGWSIYDISKVLAHANVQVTEQYLKGFDSEDLDEKMQQVF